MVRHFRRNSSRAINLDTTRVSLGRPSPVSLQAERGLPSSVRGLLLPVSGHPVWHQSALEAGGKMWSIGSSNFAEQRLEFREDSNVLTVAVIEKFQTDSAVVDE